MAFAEKIGAPVFVSRHSFLPLLHYTKRTKRYRPLTHKTEFKDRPIMYASHRDACILSRYSWHISTSLNAFYIGAGLSDCVIAYRPLGKANYDFAAEVMQFARSAAPCSILCFDVSKFFDTLDHRLLKLRLKTLLGVSEIPLDWYKVFRFVTRFSWIDQEQLKKHPVFGLRLRVRSPAPIATISEVRDAGIPIKQNTNAYGIPQGTPISSALSNLYLMDFDTAVHSFCSAAGAMYRRYSDDILVVCKASEATSIETFVKSRMATEKLVINDAKTERRIFDPAKPENSQYLGFHLSPDGAFIRPSSLAKQWRKLRRNLKRIRKVGEAAIAAGKANKIFTKKLRKRFTAVPGRNFSAYARRSAKALKSRKLLRQVRRLEREADAQITAFDSLKTPKGLPPK